jgi:isopenicillin-N N-acyltransferase-like protein
MPLSLSRMKRLCYRAVTVPVVELEGDAFAQGRQHGLALREQIAHNLAVYYKRFLREGQLDGAEVRSRASRYLPVLESFPDYFDAVRGVAETSNQELIDLVMLNVRYELLYYQYSVIPVGGPDGCTAFAALPSATSSGHLLIGENWDWIPKTAGAMLHTRSDSGFETLSFTEAGIVGGKIGLNSAGVGLAINGLLSTSDDWTRTEKPFHVRTFEILRSPTLDDASRIVSNARRACSANFVLAQAPDRALDIEAAPDVTCAFGPTCGVFAHTNHFLDPSHLGIEEPHSERRPQSYTRLARMRLLLEARQPLSVGDAQACLRDHDNFPDSICRHVHPDDPPEEACPTIVSVVMDLNERALWLAEGQPCEHVYERYGL